MAPPHLELGSAPLQQQGALPLETILSHFVPMTMMKINNQSNIQLNWSSAGQNPT